MKTLLNTTRYKIELFDGQRESFDANVILQEIQSQLNADGRHNAMVEEIMDLHSFPKYNVKEEDTYTATFKEDNW